MALYETAGTIISDVAVELGLGAVADAFAATDANVVQLRALLKSTGRALVLRHAWLQQHLEYTFVTTAGQTLYPLPGDFQALVEQTGWSRTGQQPMRPLTPPEWQQRKAIPSFVPLAVNFRVSADGIEVGPDSPVGGETLAFEYLSRNWVQSAGAPAPDKDAPTVSSDTVRLDVQLITRALKLAFRREKGFDSLAAQQDFEEALSSARDANATGAPVLSLTGSGACDETLLSDRNAPAAGYGFDGGGLF